MAEDTDKKIPRDYAGYQKRQPMPEQTIVRVYGLFLALRDRAWQLQLNGNGSGQLQNIKSERAYPWASLDEAETVLHLMVSEQYSDEGE